MSENQYYSVTTRRFTLRSNHEDWLKLTQDLYNEILLFYYHLLLDMEEEQPDCLICLSNQQILRKLEVATIVGRDKEPAAHPLPWNKIPLYFRRAAINGAISSAKSHINRKNSVRKQLSASELKSAEAEIGYKNGKYVNRVSRFKNGITFYKGTYRNISTEKIHIKIWNGEVWKWINCRLSGNFIPENAQLMSPTIYTDRQETVLFQPVKIPVQDGRKTKDRMRPGIKVCSVQFTNEDYFAVGVVMDETGRQYGVRFFKGGREYASRCGEIVEKINCAERAMGMTEADKRGQIRQFDEKRNNKYWIKLKHIREYYAHSVSRQIVDFCNENDVKAIILPKYDEKFTRCVMLKSGNWSSIHLSTKIRELLSYKAWQAGILIYEVNPSNTSGFCEKCGASIKKKKDVFHCQNGHQGNKFINSARNLGRKCLDSFTCMNR